MQIRKFMCCASIYMLISSLAMTGQAADKQTEPSTDANQAKTQPTIVAKVPIAIEADKLSFSDSTGDLLAQGHVILTKDVQVITTDEMRGNTKQTEVWIDGKTTLKEPGTKLVGTGARYNYTSEIGNMQKVTGQVGKEYLTSGNLEFSPEKMVAHDGTVTRCPAIVPDYHISAEKVEIWPGQKMVAYNAKFWIGKTIIYSVAKYETSLVPGEQNEKSAFPRIGYNSSKGFHISQYFEYPIAKRLVAFADVAYSSKKGFVPNYGFISRQNAYSLKLYEGREQNGDDEWIKREPELILQMKPKRFGNFVGDFSATTGKWSEGAVSGWRQDYRLYVSRDPIQIGSKVTLNLGTGLEKIYYGYDKSNNNIASFNATVTVRPNDRLETWAGYSYYNQSGKSVYEYDKIDIARELSSGFMYKMDDKNSVGIKMKYDIDLDSVKEIDYTWKRNLHCFEADITYRAKRDQFNVKVSTVEW